MKADNKMKNKKNSSKNYLDYIPAHGESLTFTMDDTGLVTLFIENKGLFHFLAQKFLNKPPVSQIHLDQMGSFIWTQINGMDSIYEIAQKVQEHFGKEAEPLYNRLVHYMRTLEDYRFISIKQTL